ncbi:hypothetical protein [Sinomicrobium weinanense]|uniref:Uncharacterized protein n=1 Tax=Sinomicrobium weinanense TaxID=2842200 RepID=A0A926Q3I9_9FLAO|nr:hypothetical protein [Sinomicrobium weinanense]MBC9795820.1 hypothetical protein [Sinomicrobium weinanense]MBU3121864.1 hypothetical protein [Sinomicrobium weinanense]
MRTLKYFFTTIFLFAFAVLLNAQDTNSLQRAIEKGKADLVEILNQSEGKFNFGVSAAAVERSQPASALPHKEMLFDRLLKYEGQDISEVLSKTQKLVVPLVENTRVVTTISITEKDQDTYVVNELVNQQYSEELNRLPDDIKARNFEKVGIIYVPNLNAFIYTYGDRSYTSYKGKNVSSPANTRELLKELRVDAEAFHKKYGDKLKKGKLVY